MPANEKSPPASLAAPVAEGSVSSGVGKAILAYGITALAGLIGGMVAMIGGCSFLYSCAPPVAHVAWFVPAMAAFIVGKLVWSAFYGD